MTTELEHDEITEIERDHDIDFDRALVLMNLIEKITTVSPMSTALMGLAQLELKSINDQAIEVQHERALEDQRLRDKEAAQRQHEQNVAAREAEYADDSNDPDGNPATGNTPLAQRRL